MSDTLCRAQPAANHPLCADGFFSQINLTNGDTSRTDIMSFSFLATPRKLSRVDGCYVLILPFSALFAWYRYQPYMDVYEQTILWLTVPVLSVLGWHWQAFRWLLLGIGVCSLTGIALYQQDLHQAAQVFVLKYMLSSQSAILWMSLLFFLATGFYWLDLLCRFSIRKQRLRKRQQRRLAKLSVAQRSLPRSLYGEHLAAGQRVFWPRNRLTKDFIKQIATGFCWSATLFGWVGLCMRWYESYLISTEVGHIPISNLYEVFVLFCLMTAMFYLYYQQRYVTQALGAFVMLIIAAAVSFLLWYTLSRHAHYIQPLVPALQSWWMKIHVPANFIGYGTFALAAMVALAYLLKHHQILAAHLPPLSILDDLMYRAITVGFTFFTIATILGALWAADAWGGYWNWDPKEAWALIVWLNYAAWLHMRLIKGLRGTVAAWWALIGLLITTFAFLGVNLFLAGLHSYGQL